jgi:hypothetical protein
MYTIIHVYWFTLVPPPLASTGEHFSASQGEERGRKGGCVSWDRGKGAGPKHNDRNKRMGFFQILCFPLWMQCSSGFILIPDCGCWKPIGCSLTHTLKPDWLQDVTSGSWRLQQFTLTQPNSINILWLVPQESGALCAGIFKQSMGARNRVGKGLSYRPAGLHSLAELIHWNRSLGSINV